VNSLKNDLNNNNVLHSIVPDAVKEQSLIFELENENTATALATVVIPAAIVDAIYKQASISQKINVQAFGFHKGEVPVQYIAENFKANLTEHLKEFLFKYFVLGFLFQEIRNNKLLVVGEPRLVGMHIEPATDARFKFELSLFPPLPVQEWKYLPFKAPRRKNYKDLDRQVETFIEQERNFLKTAQVDILQVGDWVSFDVCLLDDQSNPLLGSHKVSMWLKLGDEEADSAFHEIFLGKSLGESFITVSKCLQEYFSDQIDTNYAFFVSITDVLKNSYFCIELFKKYFKLKTNKDLFHKFIEVFSYRNDISLRRSMAEESLKLLISKHRFVMPNYLVLRQQKVILDKVKSNPDYHVYRTQKDFQERVCQLAEKQIRETVFLDQLAYYEDLEVSNADIKGYLHLTNRQRMKDFLYFDVPSTKVHGQEIPLLAEELKRFYLREKSLNHIIYHLTKK